MAKFYEVDMSVRRCRFDDLFPPRVAPVRTLDLRNLISISSRQIADGSFGSVFKGHVRTGAQQQLAMRLPPRLSEVCSRELDGKIAVKCAKHANHVSQLVIEMQHLLLLRHSRIVDVLGFTVDENDRWALVMPRYERGTLSSLRALRELPVVLVDVASALAYVHERGFVHADVKESNVLLHQTMHTSAGQAYAVLRGVLADFGSIQRVDSPRKDPKAGSTRCDFEPAVLAAPRPQRLPLLSGLGLASRRSAAMFRDPRMRGGEYGTEVDIYGFGCLLQAVFSRATEASLPQALTPLADLCKHSALENRPSARLLTDDLLPPIFAMLSRQLSGGSSLRERAGFDDLLAFAHQQARHHSRLSGTGSELHSIAAAPPPPRPLEAVAAQGTEVPGELDEVDRENIVYTSANKYHHRSCSVIDQWHRSGRTGFRKQPFESIARRVSYKPCSRCAHHFRFRFNVFPGPGRGPVMGLPAVGRPAPYPMDDVGEPPWYAELREPSGDPRHPIISVLGPIHVQDAFAARAEALRYMCGLAWTYRNGLRTATRCPLMAGYKEQPAPPQRRADGQDGMDIEFETSSGDKVYVAVRPALVALNSLGWPAGGDLSAAEADDDLCLYDDEDSDWEDNVPRLVEEWPGWGRSEVMFE